MEKLGIEIQFFVNRWPRGLLNIFLISVLDEEFSVEFLDTLLFLHTINSRNDAGFDTTRHSGAAASIFLYIIYLFSFSSSPFINYFLEFLIFIFIQNFNLKTLF